MESIAPAEAFDWYAVDLAEGYLDAVRLAFGSGGASSASVIEHLVPPMRLLQTAQIEVTTWCNFACRECGRTKDMALGRWKNVHIPLDRARAIIEKLPRTKQMYLQGVGEPTLHPRFAELIRIASESGKFDSIHFNTNGHTHDEAYWRNLGRYPGLTVALSVDSLDPAVATICRGGTDVDVLWSRLALFRETFKWFVVTMVASRLNLLDIEQTLRRIAAIPNVPVQITRMMSEDETVLLDEADEVWLAARLAALRTEIPSLQVYFNPMNSGVSGQEKRCISPFTSPFVRADGYLTPCCAALSPDHYGFTRADDSRTWDEVRGDPSVVRWVTDFVSNDPVVCQGCSLNPAQSAVQKHG